jgi:DNA primase
MRSCWARSSKYYHQTLLQSPEALEYLQRRGIGHEEVIRTFKLGTVTDCVRASKAARRALVNFARTAAGIHRRLQQISNIP